MLRSFGLLVIAILALAAELFGVGTTATVVGTVSDPSGAVVAKAKVMVRNESTNAEREVETNSSGEYNVQLLPPGTYSVIVEATGFSRSVLKGTKIDVDQTARVDVVLQIGQVAQEIVVTEQGPLVQADSSTVGQVVDQQKVSQLPLNERNFLSFTLLVPGAQMSSDGSQNSTQGGSISVDGAREQSNNFLLDGVDNNDLAINQYSTLPSVDAIQEFKVQSANSDAQFGRSGGAQINVALKSGTNSYHGTAFEFTRNRHLDAKNFFDQPDCTAGSVPGTCADIPRFDRNQFGETFGGPIKKNKTFFFVSYETLRLRQATTRLATVPSQGDRSAALAAVPSPNPSGLAVFNLLPAANVGAPATSTTFVSAPIIRNTVNLGTVKIDHQFRDNDILAGHYSIFDENRFNPFDPLAPFTSLPGYGSFTINRGQNIGITWTHIFNPSLTNEARVGFNRLRSGIFQQHFGSDLNQQLGFPDVLTRNVDLGFPNIFIAGVDGIGEPENLPQDRHDNTFHYADNMAWSPSINGGRHQFKFGADIRRFQLNFYLDPLARGEWDFTGAFGDPPLKQLLLGVPDFALGVRGDTFTGLRTTNLNFYIQDDIRLTSRFTLNAGLRYEYNSPPTDVKNRLAFPDFTANALTCSPQPDCQFIRAGTNGIPPATFLPDKNNFAPRIGFAWRPLRSDNLSLRAAYGIFYDVGILNSNLLPRLDPPFLALTFAPGDGTLNIQNVFSQPTFSIALPNMIDPKYRDGYLQHWNVGWQYGLNSNTVLEFDYVGSKGTKLLTQRNPNQQAPPGGNVVPPPFPAFGDITEIASAASSTYHSLQTRLEKRFSHGLTFLASYTWSKSIDDASALFGTGAEPGFPQNTFDPRAERGLSNFDTRHRFVLSYLYQLPFGPHGNWLKSGALSHVVGGWQVNGIFALQSGRPFTVNSGFFQSGTNSGVGKTDRPNQIADPFVAGPVPANPDPSCQTTVSQGGRAADKVRTPTAWFNPCAFAAPTDAFGNLLSVFGEAPRNNLIGPNLKELDLSLFKEIGVHGENQKLQLRVESFNLLNRPNFDLPNRLLASPTFGAIQSSNAFNNKPPRQIQLGVRYTF